MTNETDRQLWDEMETKTFEILERYLTNSGQTIQYRSKNNNDWHEMGTRPSPAETRWSGLVHEASTMWIGDDETAPVDLDYRFHGVENVYLTGGALWLIGASWSPTCTMCGLAMDLADKLTKQSTDLFLRNYKKCEMCLLSKVIMSLFVFKQHGTAQHKLS